LTPHRLGDLELPNRLVNAALTRCRGNFNGLPTDANIEYYGSRAGYGMILTECASISEDGNAFPGSISIYNEE
jgi:2,4-dienoyl-CoA reductase-like NADH-dependent reductase (Old Yellow Enzyme family)